MAVFSPTSDRATKLVSIRQWLDKFIRRWNGTHLREDGWDLWELPADGHSSRKVVWMNDEGVFRVTDDGNQELPKSREDLIETLARAGHDTSVLADGLDGGTPGLVEDEQTHDAQAGEGEPERKSSGFAVVTNEQEEA